MKPTSKSRYPFAQALPDEHRRAVDFNAADSTGLFIGVRSFEDPRFTEVPYAVDDAIDLAHLFALELGLIRSERTVLLLAGNAQKAASQQALAELSDAGATVERAVRLASAYRLVHEVGQESGPRGLYVVSFATHGFSDEGSGFLIAQDTLRRRLVRTGLELGCLFDDVAQAGSPRRLVLIDACRERLTRETRGEEVDASAAQALGQAFRDAIAQSQGQAVLSGAELGGFAYDDAKRQNGVFSSALIDGLRGAAPPDARSFITVSSLARYADEQVRAWVAANRPEDMEICRGITKEIQPVSMEDLPLAIEQRAYAAAAAYLERCDKALARLRGELKKPLTGALFDDIERSLEAKPPTELRLELLDEIEDLDGTPRRRRHLIYFFREHRAALLGDSPPEARQPTEIVTPTASRESRQAGVVWEDPVLGMRFRYISAGTFLMGSPDDEPERRKNETQHEVALTRGFWIAETTVTQGQWRALMETNPARFKGDEERPVETVSWFEAVAFAQGLSLRAGLEGCYELGKDNGKRAGEGLELGVARFLGLDVAGFRLPTEAEWEYAARAGTTTTPFWTGGNLTTDQANYDGNHPYNDQAKGEYRRETVAVRSFEPNPWGLYEVHGNVWEWVQDWYGAYEEKPVENPMGRNLGEDRVLRGGGWINSARNCRSADRNRRAPGDRVYDAGFRLVRIEE